MVCATTAAPQAAKGGRVSGRRARVEGQLGQYQLKTFPEALLSEASIFISWVRAASAGNTS